MLKFRFTPEVTPRSGQAAFVQTVVAMKDGKDVAAASWFAPAGAELAQLLSIDVAEPVRRRGIGSELLLAVYAQSKLLSRSRKEPVKRFWCVVEHEHQILGRSFLFKHGYHHLTTPAKLFRGGQDGMIYVKAFD
ncbi:MAG TPA: hypothetical protein PLD59_09560 [Tepidisphaeraceae bacterium]|nr:hypothetical protein [Tepidisphaeraceae bacterium]